MAHDLTKWMAGVAALALAVPAQAAFTGYLKIPDIPGESQAKPGVEPDEIDVKVAGAQRRDSGEAHLDYLTITMENLAGDEHEVEFDIAAGAVHDQRGHEVGHVMQQRAGTSAGQATDADHKDWIDLQSITWKTSSSGLATGKRQHKPLTVIKRIDKASPAMATAAHGGGGGAGKVSMGGGLTATHATKTYDAASPYIALSPRQGDDGPGWVKLPAGLPGCKVGTKYPHALVGSERAGEVRLEQVTVTQCASEEVTLNYERIKWEY